MEFVGFYFNNGLDHFLLIKTSEIDFTFKPIFIIVHARASAQGRRYASVSLSDWKFPLFYMERTSFDVEKVDTSYT